VKNAIIVGSKDNPMVNCWVKEKVSFTYYESAVNMVFTAGSSYDLAVKIGSDQNPFSLLFFITLNVYP